LGFLDCKLKIALVFGVINFSKSAMGESKTSVIDEITGTTVTPDAVENHYN
jgi:Na+-translocating ferredoxin:NAD+ oxidoreductase RnfG subunit